MNAHAAADSLVLSDAVRQETVDGEDASPDAAASKGGVQLRLAQKDRLDLIFDLSLFSKTMYKQLGKT